MKKQITYPKFIIRLFAVTIDLVILSIISAPILSPILGKIFNYIFRDFFIEHQVDISDMNAVAIAVRSYEFVEQITASQFFSYFISMLMLNILVMAIYFIGFWYKFGATPGKIAMRIKIVNANDYSHPNLNKFIKRFLGYGTALIGIWLIVFSKRKISLHDKIAGTIVIKS